MWTAGTQMKNFLGGYFRNCLNCDSLRWSHTHFICIPAVHVISFWIKRFFNSVGTWYQSGRDIYTPAHLEGYQTVFLNICERASIASFFASTSSVQICLASSEHLIRKYSCWAASTWFSASRNPFSSNFTLWLISTETLRSFHALSLDNFTKIHLMLYFPGNIFWRRYAHMLNTNEARFQKNFNENPSMQAIASMSKQALVKISRANRARAKFCEHLKIFRTIRYPYLAQSTTVPALAASHTSARNPWKNWSALSMQCRAMRSEG